MMVRRIAWRFGVLALAAVALIAMALLAVACGDDGSASSGGESTPVLDDANATGHELADEFLRLLQEQDPDALEAFLSEAFILQRADGSSATRADYVTRIPEIREYEISGVAAAQSGDVLVVRWDVAIDETVEGQDFATTPAPRLSTFAWDTDAARWRMTSHANFNAPSQ